MLILRLGWMIVLVELQATFWKENLIASQQNSHKSRKNCFWRDPQPANPEPQIDFRLGPSIKDVRTKSWKIDPLRPCGHTINFEKSVAFLHLSNPSCLYWTNSPSPWLQTFMGNPVSVFTLFFILYVLLEHQRKIVGSCDKKLLHCFARANEDQVRPWTGLNGLSW